MKKAVESSHAMFMVARAAVSLRVVHGTPMCSWGHIRGHMTVVTLYDVHGQSHFRTTTTILLLYARKQVCSVRRVTLMLKYTSCTTSYQHHTQLTRLLLD